MSSRTCHCPGALLPPQRTLLGWASQGGSTTWEMMMWGCFSGAALSQLHVWHKPTSALLLREPGGRGCFAPISQGAGRPCEMLTDVSPQLGTWRVAKLRGHAAQIQGWHTGGQEVEGCCSQYLRK